PAGGSNGAVVCLLDGRPRTAALAAELGLDPSQPPDHHLAVGWERLGEAVLERLGGDYTLLLWDRARRRGLLARDRLGARPLFVAESEGALLFASEIRNLLALMPARPEPDGTAMAHWLARTSPRSDRTLYAGIRRVPAAFAIRLSEAGWERWRHWRPRYQPPRKLTVDDAAEELRAGIERAVRRALDGTERPGVMLSGGFDSGAVAGSAGAVLDGGGLRAYSSVFPEDPAVDESSNIARTREWVGVPFVEAAFVAGSPLAAGIEFMT